MANDFKRNYITVTIPSGGTTSSMADLGNYVLAGIDFPAMTSTAVTFDGANPSTDAITNPALATFKPIASSNDTNYSVTVSSTAKIRSVDPANFAGVRYLRLVSGSPEAAERTITLIAYGA
jgi:hypothetical protein